MFDITGEWRRMQDHESDTRAGPGDETKEEGHPGRLSGFLPINVLRFLDHRISSLVHTSRSPSDKCKVWIVSDDSSVPLPEKTDTRAKRSAITQKLLAKHNKLDVSYKDIVRIEDNYIVRKGDVYDTEPIIADIFCSSSSRPFRVQLLQWIIERARTFHWTKGAHIELVFLFEGCTPTVVSPATISPVMTKGKATDISHLRGIAYPKKTFAEADLLIPCLVPHIMQADAKRENPDDPYNCNIAVSVIDSDVLALLIAGAMRDAQCHSLDKRPADEHRPRKLNIVFARADGKTFIDVNGIATYLVDAKVSPEMFLSFCIISGTDFFRRAHVLNGVGNTIPMKALLELTTHKEQIVFDPRAEEGFVELLAIVAFVKDKSTLWKSARYRTLRGVRDAYANVLDKRMPRYAPTQDLFNAVIADMKDPVDKEPCLLDLHSPFNAFIVNLDYWTSFW